MKKLLRIILVVIALFLIGKVMPDLQDTTEQYSRDQYDAKNK